MPTLENIPLPAMTILLGALDLKSIMSLSLVSRTLLGMSLCKVTWRKLYEKKFDDLWDRNPDKLINLLTLGRFESVDDIKLETKKRRGILTWAIDISTGETKQKLQADTGLQLRRAAA